MDYQLKPNPFFNEAGLPLEGKEAEASAFAREEYERFLNSLTPEQRAITDARHRNFQNHMSSGR